MKKIQRFPNLFWITVLPNILKIHPQVLSVRELHVCFKVLNTMYIFICKVMLTIKTVILPPCILSAVQKKGVQFYMCPYVKEVRNNKCCSFSALPSGDTGKCHICVAGIFSAIQSVFLRNSGIIIFWTEGISERRLQGINVCKSNISLWGELLYLYW